MVSGSIRITSHVEKVQNEETGDHMINEYRVLKNIGLGASGKVKLLSQGDDLFVRCD